MVLPVTKIMRKKVATCKNTASVYDAVKVLKKFNTSTVVILERGNIVGVFSERDLVNKVVFAKKDPSTTSVLDVMSSPPVTAPHTVTDIEIASLIAKHHITKVPIVKGNKVVGIVAEHDLLLHLAESVFEK